MYKTHTRSIGIFGLARTGIATYEYLIGNSNVICFDDNLANRGNFIIKFGSSSIRDIENEAWTKLDYIVLSPGIPLHFPSPHRVVQIANKHSIPLISDIELLYLDNPDSNYIAVTGTNGKSTTTSLIGHILSDYVVAGNIGVPSLSVPSRYGYILELSSYQLDLIDSFKANVAVLLNVTMDHIDRHGSMDLYIEAKKRIYRNMGKGDSLVIGIDNDVTREIYNSIKERSEFNIYPISIKNHPYNIPDNIFLQGNHNLENILAAIEVAKILGYKDYDILAKIQSFVGLKHRMEFVRSYKNIHFYNDSKATNADSASKSLSTLNNIYWIAGGVSKEGGINSLTSFFPRVRKAYLFGQSKEEFAKTLEVNNSSFDLFDSLKDALKQAVIDAKNDQCKDINILLAPAAASLDQFKNFEERGEVFTKLVLSL